MKLEPSPYFVNKVITLNDSVRDFLRQRHGDVHDSTNKPEKQIQGGILSDIRYSWLSSGPKLEIVHTKTGTKIAAWSFGAVLHDFETCITCVVELPGVQGKLPLLIIGLECEIGGGMVCLFDVNSSRVIRAIQIDDRVTNIYVVNAGCDISLPGALRAMDGVLAVGTVKGKVFLIDLCRQICEEAITNNGFEVVRDEINACHLIRLSFLDLKNLDSLKERSLNSGDHLALQLNELSTMGEHFALHGPNGEIRLHANMEEVVVSALHYCPQLGSLLVGFNFGGFQLYNLLSVELEYTSPVYEECLPITNFAIQEPCDDPRAFCYVWVLYNIDDGCNGFPMAVMYALAYNTKDFLEGYGYLYQEFTSCSVRFQVELTAIPGFKLSQYNNGMCSGSRCISLRSYTKSIINRQSTTHHDIPDEKLALCSFVWTAWDGNLNKSETYLCLFDLNQWYKEQMPESTKFEHNSNSYMSCESLSELLERKEDSNFFDVRLDEKTLNPFVCAQRLEEHYYPTALAFNAVCIRDKSIAWFGNLGVQRHLLMQLEQTGPLRLLRPSDLFHRCIALGLIPSYSDVSYGLSTPLNVQREMILSVSLEHQLIRWLCDCARDWSNGSQSVAGCTLDMLLNWAWQRANTLKFQSDKLCIPLFDHSGLRLDTNALLQLNNCACQIKHLTTLFETVVNKCTTYLSEQDVGDIQYQCRMLQMISTYLEVVQWLLNVGLLPEYPLSMYPRPDDSDRICAPYPAENLIYFYDCKRLELNKLRLANQIYSGCDIIDGEAGKNTPNSLLFIDNLIDIECSGRILRKQWECDGGNGLYPPPSLQALLRAYLIEDIDIVNKHCLFIYVFLDLAMTLDENKYKSIITNLIKFPAVFKLSPSIIKITQAFWQLDHGDFSTALTQLLDPSVNNGDLKLWHHRNVLKTLLLQGQYQHALLYQQVRKPPLSTVRDICIVITLLIFNDLLQEAFHFQRQHRNHSNEKELLKHFYTICDKTNKISSILNLRLCPIEEKEFMNYLQTNLNNKNKSNMIIYYIQRNRYSEALEMNINLNNNEIAEQGLLGQKRKAFGYSLVSGLRETLPEITRNLLDHCTKEKQKITHSTTNAKRPVPMSVFIHNSTSRTKYKSNMIEASLQNAKETWTSFPDKYNLNETPFISVLKSPSSIIVDRIDTSVIMKSTTNKKKPRDYNDEDVIPAKRMKLSGRPSISENQSRKRLSCYNSNSLLSTPIVKRKSFRSDILENSVIGTPPSILKVRSYIRNSTSPEIRGTSVTPELLNDDQKSVDKEIIMKTAVPPEKMLGFNFNTVPKRSSLSISSRKSLLNTTPRLAHVVHFEEGLHSNSVSSNESDHDHDHDTPVPVKVSIDIHREQTPDKSDSKTNLNSTDDVYYSASSHSLSDSKINNDSGIDHQSIIVSEVINLIEETCKSMKARNENNISGVQSRKTYKPISNIIQSENISVSKKRDLTTMHKDSSTNIIKFETSTPVKLEKSKEFTQQITTTEEKSTPEKSKTIAETMLLNIVPKVSGRRSLSRRVMEYNMFAQAATFSTPRMQLRSSNKTPDSKLKNDLRTSYSESTKSTVKIISENKTEEVSKMSTIEKSDEFTMKKDIDTSERSIKHIHNELETKHSVKKIIETVEDDNVSEQVGEKTIEIVNAENQNESCILSYSSDISDSETAHFYHTLLIPEKKYSILSVSSDEVEISSRKSQLNEQEVQENLNQTEIVPNKSDENINQQSQEYICENDNDVVKEQHKTENQRDANEINDEEQQQQQHKAQSEMEMEKLPIEVEKKEEEHLITEEDEKEILSSDKQEEEHLIVEEQEEEILAIKEQEEERLVSEDHEEKILAIEEQAEHVSVEQQKAECLTEEERLSVEEEEAELLFEEQEEECVSVEEEEEESSYTVEEEEECLTIEEQGEERLSEKEEEEQDEEILAVEEQEEKQLSEEEHEDVDEQEIETQDDEIVSNISGINSNNESSDQEEEEQYSDTSEIIEIKSSDDDDDDDDDNDDNDDDEDEEVELSKEIETSFDKSEELDYEAEEKSEPEEISNERSENESSEENKEFHQILDAKLTDISKESFDSSKSEKNDEDNIDEETNENIENSSVIQESPNELERNIVNEDNNSKIESSTPAKFERNIEIEMESTENTTTLQPENIECLSKDLPECKTIEKSTEKNIVEKEIEIELELKQKIDIFEDESDKQFEHNENDKLKQQIDDVFADEITKLPLKRITRKQSGCSNSSNIIEPLPVDDIFADETTELPSKRTTRKQSVEQQQQLLEPQINEEPTRRITRKRSTSTSTSVDIEEISSMPTTSQNIKTTRKQSVEQQQLLEPQTNEEPSRRITRKRSSSTNTSVDVEEISSIPTTSQNIKIDNEIKVRAVRRTTRASSVSTSTLDVIEEEKPISKRTRSSASVKSFQGGKRAQSLEPELKTKTIPNLKTSRKRTYSLQSKSIDEEMELEVQSDKNIPEQIEEYSTTHRLTRHQKMIMTKSLELQEIKKLQESSNLVQINPSIKESPTSSSISTSTSVVSTPKRRRTRRSSSVTTPESINSDHSMSVDRPRRISFTRAQQAISTTPRSKRSVSRENSLDSFEMMNDAASTMSAPVVCLTHLNKTELLRHRSCSPTELISRNKRKSIKTSVLPTKLELSKISEEASTHSSQGADKEPSVEDIRPKKEGRSKTVEKEKPGSSQSESKSQKNRNSTRSKSYKPLETYLPEHAIIKTRKSFKIRKFSASEKS